MIKLIVFDWDGTLSDSIATIVAAKQYAAKKLSLPLPDRDTANKLSANSTNASKMPLVD